MTHISWKDSRHHSMLKYSPEISSDTVFLSTIKGLWREVRRKQYMIALSTNTIHLYLAVEVNVSIVSRLCTLQVTLASHFHPGVGQNGSEREREREREEEEVADVWMDESY